MDFMKKNFVIGALAFSALSFANQNVESAMLKENANRALFGGVYTVLLHYHVMVRQLLLIITQQLLKVRRPLIKI